MWPVLNSVLQPDLTHYNLPDCLVRLKKGEIPI
jgi:hypothetical protein